MVSIGGKGAKFLVNNDDITWFSVHKNQQITTASSGSLFTRTWFSVHKNRHITTASPGSLLREFLLFISNNVASCLLCLQQQLLLSVPRLLFLLASLQLRSEVRLHRPTSSHPHYKLSSQNTPKLVHKNCKESFHLTVHAHNDWGIYTLGGGLVQWLASLVAPTKLINIGTG